MPLLISQEYQDLARQSTLTFWNVQMTEILGDLPNMTVTSRESQTGSRRDVRFVGGEANAAYSECGVKLADNGSLGST